MAKSFQRCRQQRLVIMDSGLCKFDHELGYQFGCRIVLNDEPELLAGGVKRS